MKSPADALLLQVVADLGSLAGGVVFTGGAIRACHFEREPLDRIRITNDADAVVECASYVAYAKLLERLRGLGFKDVMGEAPICRLRSPGGCLVDVMPTSPEVLGFGNRWFESGFREAIEIDLAPRVKIKIFNAVLFAAAKVEEFNDRGKADPWTSQDLEDFLTLIDCRPSIEREIAGSKPEIRRYIAEFAAALLEDPDVDELIQCHLGASSQGWQERNEELKATLTRLANPSL